MLNQRDPDQELDGEGLGMYDAVVSEVKAAKPDDPLVAAIAEPLSAYRVGSSEVIRTANALVIARQLKAALGRKPPGGFA
jgi:hypothetical protein